MSTYQPLALAILTACAPAGDGADSAAPPESCAAIGYDDCTWTGQWWGIGYAAPPSFAAGTPAEVFGAEVAIGLADCYLLDGDGTVSLLRMEHVTDREWSLLDGPVEVGAWTRISDGSADGVEVLDVDGARWTRRVDGTHMTIDGEWAGDANCLGYGQP